MLTRRELAIALFALAVFILSYSLPSAPAAQSNTDPLEHAIVGAWVPETRPVFDLAPDGHTMDRQVVQVAQSTLLAHVPGFTLFDNVYVVNGTIYLVHDGEHHSAFPDPLAMASAGTELVSVLSRAEAHAQFGARVMRMSGVSFLCADAPSSIDEYTLLSLHRAYATLLTAPNTPHPLPPPSRTFFITTRNVDRHLTGFSTPLARALWPGMGLLYAEEWDDLERTGRPVMLERVLLADRRAAKKASKDGEVWEKLETVDKRIHFASAFTLPAPENWWMPIRDTLLDLFSLPRDDSAPPAVGWSLNFKHRPRKVVTYVSTQRRPAGAGAGPPRLREADHVRLLSGLRTVGREFGGGGKVEVLVLEASASGEGTGWAEGLRGALRSNVMLGVSGPPLANSLFMRPSPPDSASAESPTHARRRRRPRPHPHSTIIEFFPAATFSNEREFVARALGIGYVAWQSSNSTKFTHGALPPVSPPLSPDADAADIAIDVDLVMKTVEDLLKR